MKYSEKDTVTLHRDGTATYYHHVAKAMVRTLLKDIPANVFAHFSLATQRKLSKRWREETGKKGR